MIPGLFLVTAGGLLMYLAVTDVDLKDVADSFLKGQIIVRKKPTVPAKAPGSVGKVPGGNGTVPAPHPGTVGVPS